MHKVLTSLYQAHYLIIVTKVHVMNHHQSQMNQFSLVNYTTANCPHTNVTLKLYFYKSGTSPKTSQNMAGAGLTKIAGLRREPERNCGTATI